jgi:nitroreductase
MSEARFVPLGYREPAVEDMRRRAREFRATMETRRTVREFSARAVPREVIEDCLRAAATAPSGANMQPWRFVVVEDPAIRQRIRAAAEAEERQFYEHRAPREWLDALAPLGTGASKPFLEIAPCLIAVFEQRYGRLADGRKVKHYYPNESVGLATGMLLTALHWSGLVSLTHTPSPMKFLNEILGRPRHERPFLLVVAGYPAEGARVPDIRRRPFDEIVDFL